jgi:hypothetical protein
MPEYGIRTNNDSSCPCTWCGYEVTAGEQAVEVGLIGFYGHPRCRNRYRSGRSRSEVRSMELAFRVKKGLPVKVPEPKQEVRGVAFNVTEGAPI